MSSALRTLIVDDEPLAREGLRMVLSKDPEIVIVGEAGDGETALALASSQRPDLILLDVQLPELTGFEILGSITVRPLPQVIFVTAYDRYALKAFEVHALDYLLKPFDDLRLEDAIRRAKEQHRLSKASDLSERLLAFMSELPSAGSATVAGSGSSAAASQPAPSKRPSRLAIRDVGRVVFLDIDEIDWIEAADYYVQIHAGQRSYLHRETMQRLEETLDPEQFLRIHRSAIVNQKRIRELRHSGRRELSVVLQSGAELRVSRSQREKFQRLKTS